MQSILIKIKDNRTLRILNYIFIILQKTISVDTERLIFFYGSPNLKLRLMKLDCIEFANVSPLNGQRKFT